MKEVFKDIFDATALVYKSKIILVVSFVIAILTVFNSLIINIVFRNTSHNSISAINNIFGIWNTVITIFQIGWSGLAVYLMKNYLQEEVIRPKQFVKKWWYSFKKIIIPTLVFGTIESILIFIRVYLCTPFTSPELEICTKSNIQTFVNSLLTTYNTIKFLTLSGFLVVIATENLSVTKSFKKTFQLLKNNIQVTIVWIILFMILKQIPLQLLKNIPIIGNGLVTLFAKIFVLFTDAFLLISYIRIQKNSNFSQASGMTFET